MLLTPSGVSNKAEVFQETYTTIIGNLISDDYPECGINDNPDEAFDSTDSYVGFISGKAQE